MFFKRNNKHTNIEEQIESTRLKLYKLLDEPNKNTLDNDVLSISKQLDKLIVDYFRQIQNCKKEKTLTTIK